MNRLLLDSNVLFRWLVGELGPVGDDLLDGAAVVAVSVATPWELAIKQASGKLVLPEDLEVAVDRAGFVLLDITAEHGRVAAHLPMHHRDPFDRVIIAQAKVESLTIVTRDRQFDRYEVDVLRC